MKASSSRSHGYASSSSGCIEPPKTITASVGGGGFPSVAFHSISSWPRLVITSPNTSERVFEPWTIATTFTTRARAPPRAASATLSRSQRPARRARRARPPRPPPPRSPRAAPPPPAAPVRARRVVVEERERLLGLLRQLAQRL